MRQLRVGRAHGRDQRLHHLRLDAVRQMARVGHVLEAAPTVGNLLVLGERIGDQRERAQVLLEGDGERFRRRAPLLAVDVHQEIERRLDRHLLAGNLEAQRGDQLVELPVPGRIAGDRFFVEQLLDAVLELIGLLLAHVLQPRPVMRERGRLHGRFQRRIVDTVQFEREEQHVDRGRRQPLLHVAVELGDVGVTGIAGIGERGIGGQPPEHVVERLVALHRLGEPRARPLARGHFGQPALEVALEAHAVRGGRGEVAGHLRTVDAGIEVVEIPLGQLAELGGRLGFAGGSGFGHGFLQFFL